MRRAVIAIGVMAAFGHVAAADPFAERAPSTKPSALPLPARTDGEGASPRATYAKLALATGAALWIGSFAVAHHARTDYVAALADPSGDRTADVRRANHDWAVAHYGATGLAIAGTLAIGAAIYLHVTAPAPHQTVLAPAIASDGAGVSLSGAF